MGAVLNRAAARRGWAVVILGLACCAVGRADEPETRTWQDASGRFKIQAKYAGMNGTNVLLQKTDGTRMQVDLDKLRSVDRLYIEGRQKKLAEDDPFKPVADEPGSKPATEPATTAAPPAARPGAAAMARPAAPGPSLAPPGPATLPLDIQAKQGAAPDVHPDWSAAVMAEMPPDGAWKLDVGPAPAASDADADARPRALPVPPKSDFFEKTKGFVVNAPGSHALIGFAMDNPKPGTTRIILGDLKTGKLLGQYRSPGVMAPLALSDSGDRVLMRMDEFGSGNSYRLELWEPGSDGLRKVWGFAPYGEMERGDRDVKWARFLGPDRFATLGGKGKLVVWDLEPLQPRTVVMIDEHCTPGISPDGKFLAFVISGSVGALEVESGRIAALQAMPVANAPFATLGFSPSGKRLACGVGTRLYVWNTEDGSAQPDVSLAPFAAIAGSSPIWTDEEHVLIGGRHLFNVASGINMCQYDGSEETAGDRTGLGWFLLRMTPKQPGAVAPARLPQPSLVEGLKRALADPNFFVLQPGATVSIDVAGVPDAAQRDGIVRALAQRLERIGAKPAAGSQLVLAATVTQGQEREISYRSFGAGMRTDNFKIRPQISGVKLTHQGQVIWETSASGLPMMDFAHLKADESLADHVKKFERPNYQFFETVELPARVARPKPGRPPGMTTLEVVKVTPSGVR